MKKMRSRDYTWLLRVALILVSLALCWILEAALIGPIAIFPAQRFAAARAVWEASGIDSYQIIVFVPYPYGYGDYRITVRNGVVAEASNALFHFDDVWIPVEPEAVENYTIEALFDWVERELEINDRIWLCFGFAQYDPEYGFPRELSQGVSTDFRVLAFEPLEE